MRAQRGERDFFGIIRLPERHMDQSNECCSPPMHRYRSRILWRRGMCLGDSSISVGARNSLCEYGCGKIFDAQHPQGHQQQPGARQIREQQQRTFEPDNTVPSSAGIVNLAMAMTAAGWDGAQY